MKASEAERNVLLNDFQASLEALGAKTVYIGLPDVEAELRSKLVSADKAVKLANNGYTFCELLYYWTINERQFIETAFPDQAACLHTDTLRGYPFASNSAFCLADFSGEFISKSPRHLLQRQLVEADRLGYQVLSAFEYEFNLFAESRNQMKENGWRNLKHFAPDNRAYSLETMSIHADLFDEFRQFMQVLDIPLDALHTEKGPGFLEAPLGYVRGIRSADNAVLFKNFSRAYFARHGILAGFMAKLSQGFPGNSGHLHLSLLNKEGRPVFADADDPQHISQTCRYFIGGLLHLLPELLLMCAHTVNAYKRLIPGSWAPVMASWGIQNRTAAVRVINDSPQATRIEFRVPAADSNPYTTLGMCLAAGLYGIRERITPPPDVSGSVYDLPFNTKASLPKDLSLATERFVSSKAAQTLFGCDFVQMYGAIKCKEAQDYAAYLNEVSPWELERYLGIV